MSPYAEKNPQKNVPAVRVALPLEGVGPVALAEADPVDEVAPEGAALTLAVRPVPGGSPTRGGCAGRGGGWGTQPKSWNLAGRIRVGRIRMEGSLPIMYPIC